MNNATRISIALSLVNSFFVFGDLDICTSTPPAALQIFTCAACNRLLHQRSQFSTCDEYALKLIIIMLKISLALSMRGFVIAFLSCTVSGKSFKQHFCPCRDGLWDGTSLHSKSHFDSLSQHLMKRALFTYRQ